MPAFVRGGTEHLILAWLGTQPDISGYDVWDGTNYVTADEFVRKVPLNPFFSESLVDKFYQMDPNTDDLLPNGRHLSNGMVVLTGISNARSRIEPDRLNHDWEIDRALEMNRWATVTNLRVFDVAIRFVAVYADGTKRIRNVSVDDPWFVKMSSITESMEIATDRYAEVFRVVKTALGNLDGHEEASIEDFAEKVTRQILGVL
jgi:hypothetical protein